MFGISHKKTVCRDCWHSNTKIFGPKTPVCYELTTREDKPMAKIINLNSPACRKFKSKKDGEHGNQEN